jgi:hypothetical protein
MFCIILTRGKKEDLGIETINQPYNPRIIRQHYTFP